jgi:hypothetical protein
VPAAATPQQLELAHAPLGRRLDARGQALASRRSLLAPRDPRSP